MEASLDNDLGARVAVLEADRESDRAILKEIQEKVNSFHDEMVRYRGFFGAITFLGSSIVVAIGLFKDYIVSHWR